MNYGNKINASKVEIRDTNKNKPVDNMRFSESTAIVFKE